MAAVPMIAQNVCLERSESSGRRRRLESPSDLHVLQEVAPAHQTQDPEQLIGIEVALAGMPANHRKAILLREWQGLSYKEIGDELSLSQSSVEMLLFRARRSLATALEQPQVEQKKRCTGGRALNIGSIVTALKTLFSGGAAVKAVAVAVSVGTVAVMGDKPSVRHLLTPHHANAHVASAAAPTAVQVASSIPSAREVLPLASSMLPARAQHATTLVGGRHAARHTRSAPASARPVHATRKTAADDAAAPAAATPTSAAAPVTPTAAPSTPSPLPSHNPAPKGGGGCGSGNGGSGDGNGRGHHQNAGGDDGSGSTADSGSGPGSGDTGGTDASTVSSDSGTPDTSGARRAAPAAARVTKTTGRAQVRAALVQAVQTTAAAGATDTATAAGSGGGGHGKH